MDKVLYTEAECMIIAHKISTLQQPEPDYMLLLCIAVGVLFGLFVITFCGRVIK